MALKGTRSSARRAAAKATKKFTGIKRSAFGPALGKASSKKYGGNGGSK